MRDTSLYKDINQFSPTSREYSVNEMAVYQSIINILRTSFSSIPFTSWGADLEDELFELYDSANSRDLLLRISSGLSEEDNRVEVDIDASSLVFDAASNKLSIALIFQVEGIDGQKFEINETLSL
jgi:hypothetical protein